MELPVHIAERIRGIVQNTAKHGGHVDNEAARYGEFRFWQPSVPFGYSDRMAPFGTLMMIPRGLCTIALCFSFDGPRCRRGTTQLARRAPSVAAPWPVGLRELQRSRADIRRANVRRLCVLPQM